MRASRTRTHVQSGLDRASEMAFAGRRLGLVTNPTGIDRYMRPAAAVLAAAGATVAAIFGPEHGYTGVAHAGEWVEDARDATTGAPIYSLYRTGADGTTPVYAPPPGSLDGLDALVFDIQDVGARYYTYPTTLGLLLEHASLPVIVLDRPNPLGGVIVEGPTLAPGVTSFVGRYPTPVRHSLTLGEWATWVNARVLNGRADLTVIEMMGWRRAMGWGKTGLPWITALPESADARCRAFVPRHLPDRGHDATYREACVRGWQSWQPRCVLAATNSPGSPRTSTA